MITALSGGVGGAKLALGLARALPACELTVVVNTADDLRWHGLYVAPDVDTTLYTLAGLVDAAVGWGLAGDTSVALEALAGFGFEPWFRVGDRDLATHIARTTWLDAGVRYTDVVARLAAALGVAARVLPMSDRPVHTIVHTAEGDLEFQEYFVHRRAEVAITGITFAGAPDAPPSADVLEALGGSEAVLVGPSNPFVSIGSLLALPGMREQLRQGPAPVVAVSPIVGGRALKGPADRMLRELGFEASALAVARLYADFLDGFVLDVADRDLAPAVEALGLRVLVTQTVMSTLEDKQRLACEMIAFGRALSRRSERRMGRG